MDASQLNDEAERDAGDGSLLPALDAGIAKDGEDETQNSDHEVNVLIKQESPSAEGPYSIQTSNKTYHEEGLDSEGDSESENEDLDPIRLPLAELIRPKTLADYIGQTHLINDENGSIKNYIKLGFLPSMILYGPPGVGKTTIASILARETNYVFLELSATDSTISDMKSISNEIAVENSRRRSMGKDVEYLHVVVFIDEIHRFSKVQQDYLLPFIESGHFVFIGATTVDPKVRIRRAIMSRCQLFQLKSLTEDDLVKVCNRALLYENIRRRVVYNYRFLKLEESAIKLVVRECNGDSRTAINIIELLSGYFVGSEFHYISHPFEVSHDAVKSILRRRNRSKNHSRLNDPRNLNLLLALYDSMRNVESVREIETIYPDVEIVPTQRDEVASNTFEDSQTYQNEISQFEKDLDAEVNAKRSQTPHKAGNNSKEIEKSPAKLLLPKSEPKPNAELAVQKQVIAHKYANLLEKYTMEELDAKIQYSDDSDFEQIYLDTDSENEDVGGCDFQNLSGLDRFVYLSKYYMNAIIERGESPLFILKHLLLFTSLYADGKEVSLVDGVSMIKAIESSSVDPKKVLNNYIEQITKARKRPMESELHDPIKRLKSIHDFTKRGNTEEVLSVNETLPVSFDEGLSESLLADDLRDSSANEASKIDADTFPIEAYDNAKHSKIYDLQ